MEFKSSRTLPYFFIWHACLRCSLHIWRLVLFLVDTDVFLMSTRYSVLIDVYEGQSYQPNLGQFGDYHKDLDQSIDSDDKVLVGTYLNEHLFASNRSGNDLPVSVLHLCWLYLSFSGSHLAVLHCVSSDVVRQRVDLTTYEPFCDCVLFRNDKTAGAVFHFTRLILFRLLEDAVCAPHKAIRPTAARAVYYMPQTELPTSPAVYQRITCGFTGKHAMRHSRDRR